MPTITIRSTDKALTIISEQSDGSRKDYPNRLQSGVETQVKRIHEKCKGAANYIGASIHLEEIDWYDSCDSYTVPGASMMKGDRKVRNNSYESNDIPKGFDEHITIKYKATTRNARPIGDALDALGVRVDVKEVQKMLKKNNGEAYICGGKVTSEFDYDY